MNTIDITNIMTFLYAIVEDVPYADDVVKIGITDDVSQRIKDLQTGNARPLRCRVALDTFMADILEKELHAVLKPHASYHKYGAASCREWFHLSIKSVDRLFLFIYKMAQMGISIEHIINSIKGNTNEILFTDVEMETIVNNYSTTNPDQFSLKIELVAGDNFKTTADTKKQKKTSDRKARKEEAAKIRARKEEEKRIKYEKETRELDEKMKEANEYLAKKREDMMKNLHFV